MRKKLKQIMLQGEKLIKIKILIPIIINLIQKILKKI